MFLNLYIYSGMRSRDIEELKTESETYRRNPVYLFTPVSLLSERLAWSKGRKNRHKMN